MTTKNEKTTQEYWESVNGNQPRLRLPSSLIVGTRNLQRTLKEYIKPQMNVLEIGCAPGKLLVWVAKVLKAKVSGIDYSNAGLIILEEFLML